MASRQQQQRIVGTVGVYDDVNALKSAASKVRDAGYSKWDCHTPYPVHGLDQAMGLRASPVPTITLSAGLVGFLCAVALQGGLSVFQYPTNIGGKPLFAWPAFVPIMFELFVLFAALATFAAIVYLGKLGRWHSPLHDTGVMSLISSNRFCIVLAASDSKFSEQGVESLLRETGCVDIRSLVENDDGEGGVL